MLTVFMATHNGAEWIGRTLASFCALDTPEGGYNLIVIDNASKDDTSGIVEHFQDRLPITLLQEEIAGKNRALNRGLHHLKGDLAVFTDDDVVVPKDWLVKYRELAGAEPDFSIFGGRIAPLWPEDPPVNIIKSVPLTAAYAVHPDEMEEGPVVSGKIWGANMAVRSSLFTEGNSFNEKVGPAQGNYVMGSETDFTKRMADTGHRCWFANDITVQHIIRSNQLTPDWIAARAQRFGRQAARIAHQQAMLDRTGLAPVLSVLRGARIKPMLMATGFLGLGKILNNERLHLKGLWRLNYHKSAARELRMLRRQDLADKQ